MDQMASAVSEQNAAAKKAEEDRKAEEARKAAEAASSAPPAEPVRTKAGRAQVGEGGYLTAIVGARRRVLNESESWAWKQAVQHFKATEGRKPKDHKEFMEKVVKPLQIDLGYIEEGQEFLYDPSAESDGDLGVLYVVEKAEEPAAK
jgi:hypothetical protein